MLVLQLLKHERLVMVMVMIMMVPDNISGHTTCTAITTVYNTSVTCLFGEDISKLSFNVQFFPNTSVDPEMVLLCNKLMSGELTCHKGSQVLFDEKKKIVDRFTLSRPPSLTKLNGGHYQCHAVPSLREKSQVCPLTYRDVIKLVPLESLSTPHPQPHPPKVGSDAIQTFTMVFIIIILILFIVLIIAGVCLLIKRKRRTAQKWRPGDVEDAKRNEGIALSPLSYKDSQHTESSARRLHKDADEDESDESVAAMDEHRPNLQSSQQAPQYVHPGPPTACSPQYPATSPVHHDIQPSHTGPVRKSSVPPCPDTEDVSTEVWTDAVEDVTLMRVEHEAGPNTGEHGVGGEVEMDTKARKEELKADLKIVKEELTAVKKAKKEELKADTKAKEEKLGADTKAKEEELKALKKTIEEELKGIKKAKKEKKADKKPKEDENRDVRGSEREENVVEHKMQTEV